MASGLGSLTILALIAAGFAARLNRDRLVGGLAPLSTISTAFMSDYPPMVFGHATPIHFWAIVCIAIVVVVGFLCFVWWQCVRKNWHPQASAEVEEYVANVIANNLDHLKDPQPIQSCEVELVSGKGPFNTNWSKLPKSLRGIFWLTEQGSQSTLMSFGGPGNDCDAGYSTGELTDKGIYAIRLCGDAVWSYGEAAEEEKHGNSEGDKTYIFHFDDPEEPTYADIVMYNPQKDKWLDFKSIPGWALQFWMRLMTPKQAEQAGYPNSIIWLRKTAMCRGPLTYDYKLVQVIDENGARLEPAWSDMIDYVHKNSKPSGSIWYRAAEPWIG